MHQRGLGEKRTRKRCCVFVISGADQIRLSINGHCASSDLHAADAPYHEDCRKRFCGRLVQKNERADDDEAVDSDDNSDEFRQNVPSGSMSFLAILLI